MEIENCERVFKCQKTTKRLMASNRRMEEIISCSRRTDMPAFYMSKVLEWIRAGEAPSSCKFSKFPSSARPISLVPNNPVRAFVWWSKDFGLWIKQWQQEQALPKDSVDRLLSRYDAHTFNFTINTPCELEPGVPSLEARLDQLSFLAKNFGPESIVLRFDPITLWISRDGNQYDNLGGFTAICKHASNVGVKSVTVAFAITYSAVKKRAGSLGVTLLDLTDQQKSTIVHDLHNIASSCGVALHACCLPTLMTKNKNELTAAGCVNGQQINSILLSKGRPPLKSLKSDTGQRGSCCCTKSADIGSYEFTCNHGCVYCYAKPKMPKQ